MKNILILSLVLFINVLNLKAQENTYEDILDDPEKLTFIQAGIGLWDINLNVFNLQKWNLNPRLFIQHEKSFSFEIEGYSSKIDRAFPTNPNHNFSDAFTTRVKSNHQPNSANSFNVIGTWFFLTNIDVEHVNYAISPIFTKSVAGSIRTNIMHCNGLRLGYTKAYSLYTLSNEITKNLERTDISGKFDNVTITDGEAYTTADYAYFRIGYSNSEIINKIISTEKFGEKEFAKSTTFYWDLFIPQKFITDDMMYNNTDGSSPTLLSVTVRNNKRVPLAGCFGA